MAKPGKPLRVGFLGTGYIADWHAKALKSLRGVELVASCDANIDRARSFGRRHGVDRPYGSLDAMLGDAGLGLDVVHVLLPPDLHADAAGRVIDAGVHVLLEKPMATSAEECSGLIARAEARGVKVGVNHNFLFATPYERLRADLAAGVLGRPDQVTITWNKDLGQLQAGPFDIWMLRDPRNILLEIGPHAASAMLDLVGPQAVLNARASNPVTLPGGARFYRRWQVDAGGDACAVTLNFSFTPGFAEQAIHVRGSLAAATADLERDAYVLHRHTKNGPDYDRYRMLRDEADALRSESRRTFGGYLLSKFKLSRRGNPYGVGIEGAMKAFYAGLSGAMDRRISAEMGRDVIALCAEFGRASGIAPAAPTTDDRPRAVEVTAPAARPEILVLGATGFIGRELVRQLIAGGHAVRVLVRNPGRLTDDLRDPLVEVMVGDLARPADVDRALDGIRCVYHLARAAAKTWEEYVEQDVEITRRLAEACLARGIGRLIYTGTIDSYYAGARAGTITEATGADPHIGWRNYYARAKAASEDILMAMHRERGLPVVIFRPGIVIGRGTSPLHWGVGMWSYNAVCQVWGRGDNPLPLVLVEDVAAALVAALDAEKIEGESFNLIADTKLTARDYLRALEQGAGMKFRVIHTSPWSFYATDLLKGVVKRVVRHPDKRRPSFRDWESRTQKARYDCSKARSVLGWKPVDDPDEVIRRGIHLPAVEILS